MQVREVVETGQAKSQNEFVERALKRELRALHQRRLYDEYALAALDEGWCEEMDAVTGSFDGAVGDGLSRRKT